MTVKTNTALDFEALSRAYAEWDIATLRDLHAEDVEHVEHGRGDPPGAPRVRRGRDAVEEIWQQAARAGVKARLENGVVGEERAAATFRCDMPDGSKVVANSIFDLRDGCIVRQLDVISSGA